MILKVEPLFNCLWQATVNRCLICSRLVLAIVDSSPTVEPPEAGRHRQLPCDPLHYPAESGRKQTLPDLESGRQSSVGGTIRPPARDVLLRPVAGRRLRWSQGQTESVDRGSNPRHFRSAADIEGLTGTYRQRRARFENSQNIECCVQLISNITMIHK